MRDEVNRIDANEQHVINCRRKLNVLIEQREDLSLAVDTLLQEIGEGKKFMKVYRQMKMYNDPSLNPVLYRKQQDNG
jgi:hypothetical protein